MLAAGVAFLAAGAAQGQTTLGVWTDSGLSDDEVAAIRHAAGSAAPFALLAPEAMDQRVEAVASLGIRCVDLTAACWARVGAAAGVAAILTARWTRGRPHDRITLTLADGSGRGAHRTAAVAVSDRPEERRAGIEAAVRHVLLEEGLVGEALLEELPPGTLLSVDDEPVALSRRLALAPGPHRIEARADGGTREGTVVVLAGVSTEVALSAPSPRAAGPDPSTAAAGASPGAPAPSPLADDAPPGVVDEAPPPVLWLALGAGGLVVAAVGLGGAIALPVVSELALLPSPERFFAANSTDGRWNAGAREAYEQQVLLAQLVWVGGLAGGLVVACAGAGAAATAFALAALE